MFFRNRLKALANSEESSRKKTEEGRRREKREVERELSKGIKQVEEMFEESNRLLSPFLRNVRKHYLHNDREAKIYCPGNVKYQAESHLKTGDVEVVVRLYWDVRSYCYESLTHEASGSEARCLDLVRCYLNNTVTLGDVTISLENPKWKKELEDAILVVLEKGVAFKHL